MIRDQLNDNDRELFDLASRYYSMKTGCLGVLYAMSKKATEEREFCFKEIGRKANFSAQTSMGILAAVTYIAVSAKTFDEAVDKIEEAYQNGRAKHGMANKPVDSAVANRIRFSLIALMAYWEKYRSQIPMYLPNEVSG